MISGGLVNNKMGCCMIICMIRGSFTWVGCRLASIVRTRVRIMCSVDSLAIKTIRRHHIRREQGVTNGTFYSYSHITDFGRTVDVNLSISLD